MKKILSLLIAITLCLSLFAPIAFASESTPNELPYLSAWAKIGDAPSFSAYYSFRGSSLCQNIMSNK